MSSAGESRAWNAIKLNRKIKLTYEHARASRVNDQMSRYSPETYSHSVGYSLSLLYTLDTVYFRLVASEE